MDNTMNRARAWQGEITIPTYDREPDSPYPPFGLGLYPYTVFGETLPERRDRTYRAVFLENRFLKLTIVPELGGRVISAYDKLAGREIFYRNHVIKPGQVDARGAWISGGLEFSFPIAHTPTCLDSIDCVAQELEDGSARVVFGEIERLYRMKWLVELTLRPDRAAIDVRVRVCNPRPVRHRWQYWSNAAVDSTPGFQFVYPMKYAYVHAAEETIIAWPDYQGIDRSWDRNNDHWLGAFGKGSKEDFFGSYDHDAGFGVVHFADHREVPGKKMWTWGNGADGLAWATVLSDEDGPYSEIQSGRSETQIEFGFLDPYETQEWRERWYPVWGTGGFCAASGEGAINVVSLRQGFLRAAVSVVRVLADARLTAEQDGVLLVDRRVDVAPGGAFVLDLAAGASRSPIAFRLTDAEGVEVLRHTHRLAEEPADTEELARLNAESHAAKKPETAEEHFLAGIARERLGDAIGARAAYSAALEIDPGHGRTHLARAILHLKAGSYVAAEEESRRALGRDGSCSEARYHLACALREQGRLDEAEDELSRLSRGGSMVSRARIAEAEIALRKGDYGRAAEAADAGVAPLATRAMILRAIALRKLGRGGEAESLLDRVLAVDPLEFMALWERGLLHPGEGIEPLAALDRGPLGYLELGIDYANLGLYEEAAFVLARGTESTNPGVAGDPILRYHLGYCRGLLGDETGRDLAYESAAGLSPEYVFPSCVETITALEAALRRFGRDARARYYLGCLYFAGGRVEEAVGEWEASAEIEPGFAVVHRNLGFAEWRRLGHARQATAHYERAISAAPGDASLVVDLDQLYAEIEPTSSKRRELLETALRERPREDGVAERLARLYLDLGEPARALELLTTRRFGYRHGVQGRHLLYTEARIRLGEAALAAGDSATGRMHLELAMEFPESLGEDEPIEKTNERVRELLGG